MESTQVIVPDSAFITKHTTQIMGKPGAELVIDMAMTDKDPVLRLRWCAQTFFSPACVPCRGCCCSSLPIETRQEDECN